MSRRAGAEGRRLRACIHGLFVFASCGFLQPLVSEFEYDRLLGFVRGKEFLVSRALGMPCCPQLGLLHALRLRGGQNGFEENDAAPRGVGKHKERHSRSGRMRLEHKVTGRVSQESHPGRRRSRPGTISRQCVPSLRAQRVERQRWCGLGRRRPRGREHGTGEGIPESAAEEFRAAQDSLIERERSVFQRKSERWGDAQAARAGVMSHEAYWRRHAPDDSQDARQDVGHVRLRSSPPPEGLRGAESGGGQDSLVSGLALLCKDVMSDMVVVARNPCPSVAEWRDMQAGIESFRTSLGSVPEVGGRQTAGGRAIGEADVLRAHHFAALLHGGTSSCMKADTQPVDRTQMHDGGVEEVAGQWGGGGEEALPIMGVRQELRNLLSASQHRVVIIVGETGCGKSTQLPQFLLEAASDWAGGQGIIGCTQPRRVAAVSVSRRVAAQRLESLGQSVGYAIRFEQVLGPRTRIKFMTDGILLREILLDPKLSSYAAIIMDEAHERAINTDILFGLLRRLLSQRDDLRVVVTSATMNAGRFQQFFHGAPILHVAGRTFPVEVRHVEMLVEDYVADAVKTALRLHIEHPYGFPSGSKDHVVQTGHNATEEEQGKMSGDFLIFMPGQEEVEATCFWLAMFEQRYLQAQIHVPPMQTLPLYGSLPAEKQMRVFGPSDPGVRRMIVATNIAETSLTIPGVSVVIDAGYSKVKCFDASCGMDALLMVPESQANALQRAGRAGRTRPGVCVRLFSEHALHTQMMPESVPEILRCNLGHILLLLLSMRLDLRPSDQADYPGLDLLDQPSGSHIRQALYQLWVLGAVNEDLCLTRTGTRMVRFPLDPPLAKTICAGESLGVQAAAMDVVSMLSVGATQKVLLCPREHAEQYVAAHSKLVVGDSDHLTLLHILTSWRLAGCSRHWAMSHFVHHRSLLRALDIRAQLAQVLSRGDGEGGWDRGLIETAAGVQQGAQGYALKAIRKALCSGFALNAAKFRGFVDKEERHGGTRETAARTMPAGTVDLQRRLQDWRTGVAGPHGQHKQRSVVASKTAYQCLRSDLVADIHPESVIFQSGLPHTYVVYHDLLLTSRPYLHCLTAVQPDWLADACPSLYKFVPASRSGGSAEGGLHAQFFNVSTHGHQFANMRQVPRSSQFSDVELEAPSHEPARCMPSASCEIADSRSAVQKAFQRFRKEEGKKSKQNL